MLATFFTPCMYSRFRTAATLWTSNLGVVPYERTSGGVERRQMESKGVEVCRD